MLKISLEGTIEELEREFEQAHQVRCFLTIRVLFCCYTNPTSSLFSRNRLALLLSRLTSTLEERLRPALH